MLCNILCTAFSFLVTFGKQPSLRAEREGRVTEHKPANFAICWQGRPSDVKGSARGETAEKSPLLPCCSSHPHFQALGWPEPIQRIGLAEVMLTSSMPAVSWLCSCIPVRATNKQTKVYVHDYML